MVIHRTKLLSSSYLGEDLLLDVFSVLFQGDNLGGHGVNHPLSLLPTSLQLLDLLRPFLHPPNKIIDHGSQLIDLDVLSINATVEFINDLSYTIRRVSNKVHMLLQMINQVVLSMINTPQL
jgi:hypothetical protein